MKNGQKVKVKLSTADASKLGLNSGFDCEGVITGQYENGVAGHYVSIGGKIKAIADKYNALTAI